MTVIAIDGPAGAGKSTVCRLLARELGYTYLDTGAMYRAVAWALLQQGFSDEKQPESSKDLASLPVHFAIEGGALLITSQGRKLDEELRAPEVTRYASLFSQLAPIRNYLMELQRRLGSGGKIVAEGRDMTTVVFPDAPVKIFLTADLRTRTERRLAEYLQKGVAIDYSTLEEQIRSRDEADQGRVLAPLKAAPGALLLDTSGMSISEVVERLIEFIHKKTEEK